MIRQDCEFAVGIVIIARLRAHRIIFFSKCTRIGPGSHDVVKFSSFDRVSKYPKKSYISMGTVSDDVRPLTQARDEREGIAAPGSYNIGSCFDKASR